MTVLAWLAPDTWAACVEATRARCLPNEHVVLLHVTDGAVVGAGGGAAAGLLGRGRDTAGRLAAIGTEQAEALLGQARAALGREADLVQRRGVVEHEVVTASQGMDLLVLVRDGRPGSGPHSLGRVGRFVVDHATCPVLLVARPDAGPPRLPPRPPHDPPGRPGA